MQGIKEKYSDIEDIGIEFMKVTIHLR